MNINDYKRGAVIYLRTHAGEYIALFKEIKLGLVVAYGCVEVSSDYAVTGFIDDKPIVTDESKVLETRLATLAEITVFYSALRKWSLLNNEKMTK